MAWPAVKKALVGQEAFRKYVAGLTWNTWRPSMIVLHNTAAPTLAQWKETEKKDIAEGMPPGMRRIDSLDNYFRGKGWPGAPHLFIPDDCIWVFNPLTLPGTHSPSWNHLAIGIEMVADFDREDDDAGMGLVVRNNTIFATALLCSTLGLDPHRAVRLHREDPKTTHACPGKDFAQDREEVIAEVAALMAGGEHAHDDIAIAIGVKEPPAAKPEARGVTNTGGLNFRRGPGVTHESIGSLPKGLTLAILDEAPNGTTKWLKTRTPAGYVGWVAAKYVDVR